MVALEAEGAYPDLGGEVDDGEGVEDGAAGAAAERGVGEDGDVGEGLDRSVDRRHRDDAARRLLLCPRQHVPRHSYAVLHFQVHEFRHYRSNSILLFLLLLLLRFSVWVWLELWISLEDENGN